MKLLLLLTLMFQLGEAPDQEIGAFGDRIGTLIEKIEASRNADAEHRKIEEQRFDSLRSRIDKLADRIKPSGPHTPADNEFGGLLDRMRQMQERAQRDREEARTQRAADRAELAEQADSQQKQFRLFTGRWRPIHNTLDWIVGLGWHLLWAGLFILFVVGLLIELFKLIAVRLITTVSDVFKGVLKR